MVILWGFFLNNTFFNFQFFCFHCLFLFFCFCYFYYFFLWLAAMGHHTLGLMYHFKSSSLFHHCTFRDYYPSFIGAHEIHISYFNNPYQLSSRLGFFLFVFQDHFYFSVKFFGFWDVFNVSCVIILGNWFAKFLVVTVSLNNMFKGKVHWWLKL